MARWLNPIGFVLCIIAIIDLIWSQIGLPYSGGLDSGSFRWEIATGPLELFGVGVLIIGLAEILAAVQRSGSN